MPTVNISFGYFSRKYDDSSTNKIWETWLMKKFPAIITYNTLSLKLKFFCLSDALLLAGSLMEESPTRLIEKKGSKSLVRAKFPLVPPALIFSFVICTLSYLLLIEHTYSSSGTLAWPSFSLDAPHFLAQTHLWPIFQGIVVLLLLGKCLIERLICNFLVSLLAFHRHILVWD